MIPTRLCSIATRATAAWHSAPRPRRGPSRRSAEEPRRALAALAAALVLLPCAAGASGPQIDLRREGHVFHLKTTFEVRATRSAAWDVLTDYDGMTRFVTSLRKSRVVSREAEALVLEQEGVVRFGIFSRRVPVTLRVRETAPERIEFVSIADGEFEEYEGSWTVAESSGACVVSYQLFAEMKASLVPRAMARRILEKSVTRQLQQVQAEIERRAADYEL